MTKILPIPGYVPTSGGGFGTDPFVGNPIIGPPDVGLPYPTDPGGGGGGTWLEDIIDAIEKGGGIIEDIADIIDAFGGGGGGSAGSGSVPATGAFPPDGSSEESAFLQFLSAVGVVANVIAGLYSTPPYQWPGIALDLYQRWLAAERPNSDPSGGFGSLLPPDWTGSTPSPTLPTTGSFPIPGFTGSVAPMAMPAYATQVYKAPKGYVTVNVPSGNGTSMKMFVAKKVAVAMGLYKNRAKAPITGAQYRAVKKAKVWETKLSKMLQGSCNYKVTKKR